MQIDETKNNKPKLRGCGTIFTMLFNIDYLRISCTFYRVLSHGNYSFTMQRFALKNDANVIFMTSIMSSIHSGH